MTTNRDLIAVTSIALVVRLAFCFLVYPHLADRFGPGDGYDVIARNLVHGDGYTLDGESAAAERLPLYPALLALSFTVFGDVAWPWQLAQCICGALTCGLLFAMARTRASRGGAWLAAALCAAHPTLMLFTARPFTETLYTLLLLLFVRALLRPQASGRGAGALLGLQLLLKSTALLDVVAFVPLLRRGGFAASARAAAYAAMVIAPWAVWNLWTFGAPHLLTTTSGLAIYQGLYTSQHVSWTTPAGDLFAGAQDALGTDLAQHGISRHADLTQQYRVAGAAARAWIRTHPAAFARLWARNLVLTWYLGRSRLSMLVHACLHGLLLAGAVLGIVRAQRVSDFGIITILIVAAYTVLHAAIHPGVRYILPLIPPIAILAAQAIGQEER